MKKYLLFSLLLAACSHSSSPSSSTSSDTAGMLTFVGNADHTGSYAPNASFTRQTILYVQNRTDSLIGWYEYEDGGVYGGNDSSERSFVIPLSRGQWTQLVEGSNGSLTDSVVNGYVQDSTGQSFSWPRRLTQSQATAIGDIRTIASPVVALNFSTISFEDGCSNCPPGGSAGMELYVAK